MCYSVMIEKDLNQLKSLFSLKSHDGIANALSIEFANFKPEKDRIYPFDPIPVITKSSQLLSVFPMRYGAYPPSYIDPQKAKGLTTYNARQDSLEKRFWQNAYLIHHGIVVIKAFFEWVPVETLLKQGQIKEGMVQDYFSEKIEQRKLLWQKNGKDLGKFKLSATEKKPLAMRKIVIAFKNKGTFEDMLVPVIYNRHDGQGPYGCAAITKEPVPEILAVGHDRMPILLSPENALKWLDLPSKSQGPVKATEILSDCKIIRFDHCLESAL